MQQPFLLSGMKSSRAYEKKTTSATGMQKDNSYRFFLYGNCNKCIGDAHHSFRERDLLMMPSNSGSLKMVQWPLFLLTSKVHFPACTAY